VPVFHRVPTPHHVWTRLIMLVLAPELELVWEPEVPELELVLALGLVQARVLTLVSFLLQVLDCPPVRQAK